MREFGKDSGAPVQTQNGAHKVSINIQTNFREKAPESLMPFPSTPQNSFQNSATLTKRRLETNIPSIPAVPLVHGRDDNATEVLPEM